MARPLALPRLRTLFTLVMAPSRQLTSSEENAARKAFAMLQQKKLIKATTGRGRKPGMAPVHAALAIRAGEYADHGGGPLSADSQLTAAAVSYGVPSLKIKEYLDLLGQWAQLRQAREASVRLVRDQLDQQQLARAEQLSIISSQ